MESCGNLYHLRVGIELLLRIQVLGFERHGVVKVDIFAVCARALSCSFLFLPNP